MLPPNGAHLVLQESTFTTMGKLHTFINQHLCAQNVQEDFLVHLQHKIAPHVKQVDI
jgi:hypothetical protein